MSNIFALCKAENNYLDVARLDLLLYFTKSLLLESNFYTLSRVRDSLTPHRMPMLHSRKADLILISYERELAGKLQSDGQLIREISNLECWTRRPSTIAAAV